MLWRTLLRIAWRNLTRNLRRSGFGITTVAFGVAGLMMAAGFVEDAFEQLGEVTISGQLGHAQIFKAGFRRGGSGSPQEYLFAPQELKSVLEKDDRIADVMGRLSFSGVLSADGRDVAIEVEGIEAAPEARLGTRLQFLAGGALQGDVTWGAVIGEGVAKQLRVSPGDSITLTAPTIEGAVNVADLDVMGVFRSFSKEYDDRSIRVPLASAQELLQTDAVNVLVLRLNRTDDTQAVVSSVSDRLTGTGLQIAGWAELSDFYANTKAMYRRQFGVLQGIVLVLVVMSVVNTMNMTVFERMAEFGTMRVLGNRSSMILGLVVLEGLLLGIFGATVGIALGALGSSVVSYIGIPMPPPPNMESGYVARISVTFHAVATAFVVGIVSAVVASILPGIRLIRLPLIETLKRAI